MANFSRLHCGETTKAPAELRAPRKADEPLRRRAPRDDARRGFWLAMGLALLAFASAGARAQGTASAPLGDIFESGGGGPVYSDTYESDCESSNTSVFKGMNPLMCHGIAGTVGRSGGCGQGHPPLKFWKQVGDSCLYCEPFDPPLINSFVIPMDDLGVAEAQGFKCGADQTDPSCRAVCSGNGRFRPPPGTTLRPIKQPVRQTVPQESGLRVPKPISCLKRAPGAPKFDRKDVSDLTQDLATAKAIVAKAKIYTDKTPWDARTQEISKRWFGNANPATQALVRKDITNVLGLLNGIKSVTSAIYPGGADLIDVPLKEKEKCLAYVHKGDTEIFLCISFWALQKTGPESQAMTLVHEMSHMPNGANTDDVAYGQTDCRDLVFMTSNWFGQKFLAPGHKMPETGKPVANPLTNADSFMYFVYHVANQR